MDIRIGNGYDVHALAEGLPLWLGGVQVESPIGCIAHSDGDVAIHALCDALLGAANLRDIGYHFPDTDPRYKGADSRKLLIEVVRILGEKGYSFGNADITICAEQPKINPHIPAMQEELARCIGCDIDDISIKATTTEKLGFTGRQEGISAYAVALINKP